MKKIVLSFLVLAFSANIAYSQKGKVRVEIEQPFVYEGDTLSGTLLSSGKSLTKFNKLPIVIFISGSGPTDRNGNSILVDGANNSFSQLADSLLKMGVASYRYDKLGIAQSQMSKSESDLRFEDNYKVAVAAIDKMKELGFKKIVIMGHSEGSLVGMLAAQNAKVKGYISVAGPAQNALQTIKGQLEQSLPEEMAISTYQKLDSVKNGFTITKFNPALAALLRPSVQPYLKSYFAYTPSEELKKLNIPVLIIQGGRDIQVSQEEGKALSEAIPAATYKVYPKMNHVLKQVNDSREQNIASYGDPDFPLAKNLANDIANWVKKL